jgi:hypothetical protein
MLSFPQKLKNTESEVKKIREAMDLEKKTRETEAAKAKQMQVGFKQSSTKILSQVFTKQSKLLNCPSFLPHRACTNQMVILLITELCTLPCARLFFACGLQRLIELTCFAA